MKFKAAILTMVMMLLGATSMFAFNYFFLEHLFIPDPCYYHNRDTTILFDLFYDLPTSEGGHPFPTVYNLIFTISSGAFLGWHFAKLINTWRIRTNNSTHQRFAIISDEE